jgi:chemotaxis protein methyltransferase CheR
MITGRLGLQFDDGKADYMLQTLEERMKAHGCATFADYERRVRDFSREEMRALADRLTVGETYFFRYWDQFRALGDVALPDRARSLGGLRPVRVLSGGCASGEEPYSIAMLARRRPELAGLTVRGIDVSPRAIEKARRGRYSSWSLRETSPEFAAAFFHQEGREYVLSPEAKAGVAFEERNLTIDDPAFWHEGAFDVIFCRNVIMYFSPEVMSAVVERLTRALTPGGFLFLGHAETLRGISHDFHLRHTHDTFYYQRRDASSTGSVDVGPSAFAQRPPPAQALAKSLDLTDSSWVDAIQRASERITELTRPQEIAAPPAGALGPTTPSDRPDLGPVLDLLRQERFVDAMNQLRVLSAGATQGADADLLRAVLLTNSGRLAEAEALCEEILAVDELSAGAHYVMALCREHAGDRRGASLHDQTAIYLDATFAMPHLHVAILARRDGARELARAELACALTLLAREDASRILLFGGGFSRDALAEVCRSELRTLEGGP